jgi:glycosyltransferase involved in cell wall biosynthesis
MSRLKVAIATAFPADPAAPHGGVEAVSVNLVDALSTFDDLDLHVVTTDPAIHQPETYSWHGTTVHRLPHSGARVLIDATGPGRRQMHAFLTRLAPAVVHAHDVFGLMVKGLRIPRVHTIHGFIHGDTLVSGERFAWLRAQLWRRIELSGWADHPHVISISPYVRERLSPVARGVIHDIENPIAPRFFSIPRRDDGQTIFSAAVVCRRKNTLGLVEAFAIVVRDGFGGRLRLAGGVTEEDYARAVRARISELGLESRVDWLGPLKVDGVERELSSASLFALVSREENSPLGIEEAMAAGVPVVTSNRCGMPYMVSHGETGFLVDPENPPDIARRLSELLADAERRRTMGDRARRTARDRFHPAAVAARTRAVYYEATGITLDRALASPVQG